MSSWRLECTTGRNPSKRIQVGEGVCAQNTAQRVAPAGIASAGTRSVAQPLSDRLTAASYLSLSLPSITTVT